jgi:hypothetical protein
VYGSMNNISKFEILDLRFAIQKQQFSFTKP